MPGWFPRTYRLSSLKAHPRGSGMRDRVRTLLATLSLSASTHPYSIFQLGVKPEVTWLYIRKTDAEIRLESFALAHSAFVKSFSIVENSL